MRLRNVFDLVRDFALASEVGLRRIVRPDDDAGVVARERGPRQLRGVVQIEELPGANSSVATVVATFAPLICADAILKTLPRSGRLDPSR